MSVSVTVNNTTYTIPQTGETGWGDNVTSWIQAVSSSTLQKSGGTFTLSAEVDFGASFGLKSLYFKGRNSNPSSAGILRLANTDSIGWRNAANSGDKLLAVNSSDQLTYAGTVISSSSGVTPVAAGGTGISSYTAGDLLYATGATTLSKLAIGSTGQVLKVSAGLPSWGAAGATLAITSVNSAASPYTILSTDDLLVVNSSGGAVTLNLPAASGSGGKVYYFYLVTGGNVVTVARNGADTINGLTSFKFATQYDSLAMVSNGSNGWDVITNNVSTAVHYETNAGQTISNNTITILDLEDQVYDALGLVTTGASWKFTAIQPGKYHVSSAVLFGSGGSWTAGTLAQLMVYKNGSAYKELLDSYQVTSHSQRVGLCGSTSVSLAEGDYIDIRVFQTSGVSLGIITDGKANYVSIERIGN